jgi:hypothetical protein
MQLRVAGGVVTVTDALGSIAQLLFIIAAVSGRRCAPPLLQLCEIAVVTAAAAPAGLACAVAAGALMQWLLFAPLLVAAGLLAAGSIAIMLLPEMAHRPLEDTVEDAADSEVVLTALTGQSSQTSRAAPGHGSSGGGRASGWGAGSSSSGGGHGQQGYKQQLEMAPASGAAAAAAAAAARFSLEGHEEGDAGSSSTGVAVLSGLQQPGSSEEDVKAEERLGLLRAAAANL